LDSWPAYVSAMDMPQSKRNENRYFAAQNDKRGVVKRLGEYQI